MIKFLLEKIKDTNKSIIWFKSELAKQRGHEERRRTRDNLLYMEGKQYAYEEILEKLTKGK